MPIMNTYIKNCKHGQFILIHGDMISEHANLLGEWCEGEVELFNSILSIDANVIEVGSNIGMHTIPIAKLLKKGKMFCFEPQRIVYQILCGNISINNLTNVYAFNQGCSHQNVNVKIQSGSYDKPWNYGAFSVESGFSAEGSYPEVTSHEELELVSIDSLPFINELERIDLLKIDAEGHDENVLDGAKNTIQKHQPFIFIENNSEIKFNSIKEKIISFDYTPYWYCSARFKADNHNKAFWSIPGYDINMICAPKSKLIKNGLLEVGKFSDLNDKKIPLY
jgi:FkbM family methyltransferase